MASETTAMSIENSSSSSLQDLDVPAAIVEELVTVAAAGPGVPKFQAAVASLARMLEVSCAFVSENIPEKPGSVRTLAFLVDGELVENVEYELQGTPCEVVYEEDMCFVEKDIQRLYPKDEMLVEMGAVSYVGIPFSSSSGKRLGHFGLIHTKPLEPNIHKRSIFRVFSAMVGAELLACHSESSRLRAERETMETQRLKSLGVLAGGVAHDLNNLLVGITGNVSLALAEADTDSALKRYLDQISLAAVRAADLSRQMLAYSGRGRFVIIGTSLNEIVSDVNSLLATTIPREIGTNLDLADDLPLVQVDVMQLRQLVMNLVLNAKEAIDDDRGLISISTGTQHIDQIYLESAQLGQDCRPGEYVYLEVADTGCGVPGEIMGSMFDPFFSGKPNGRGLGLAAVRGIVVGHGAAMRVETQEGAGTKFRLLLPASPEDSTVSAKPPVPCADTIRQVLVIDDDDIVRAAAVMMLKYLGYSTLTASDGHEGIRIYKENKDQIDLVLLDMSMPEIDGLRTFRALREHDSEAIVVLMSGYDSREVTSSFATEELAGFLQKPFTIQDLGAVLRELRSASDS